VKRGQHVIHVARVELRVLAHDHMRGNGHQRGEEIPWLAQFAVDGAAQSLKLDAGLVAACMLRPSRVDRFVV
jgi:hypothetical protein